MKRTVPQSLRPLLGEIRSNPRLQAGLALIALLFLGWFFLVLGDLREAQVQHLEQARQRYVQVRQLSGQQVWFERASEAEQLARALDAEIPTAASPGLAQASFQGWLKEIVDSQGAPVRLEMHQPTRVETDPGIVRISATIAGGMEPQRTWQMIHRIEASAALVAIPVLTVRSDGSNKTFSLAVQGFYRIPVLDRESGT